MRLNTRFGPRADKLFRCTECDGPLLHHPESRTVCTRCTTLRLRDEPDA